MIDQPTVSMGVPRGQGPPSAWGLFFFPAEHGIRPILARNNVFLTKNLVMTLLATPNCRSSRTRFNDSLMAIPCSNRLSGHTLLEMAHGLQLGPYILGACGQDDGSSARPWQ